MFLSGCTGSRAFSGVGASAALSADRYPWKGTEPFQPMVEEPSPSARRKGGEQGHCSSEECLQTARRIRGRGDERVHILSARKFVQLPSSFSTAAKRERHFPVQIRPQSNDVCLQDEHSRTDSSLCYFLHISATLLLQFQHRSVCSELRAGTLSMNLTTPSQKFATCLDTDCTSGKNRFCPHHMQHLTSML